MKNIITILIIFAGIVPAVLLTSCSEEVISIDLNEANPKIVIVGKVTEGTGPQTVSIVKTTSFFKPGEYPPVTGASVTIADNEGNEATLAETSPGFYATAALKGIPGRTYKLTVIDGDQTYTATSIMNQPSSIDSLVYEVDDDEEEDEEVYLINTYFKDIEGRKEYYRFRIFVNDEPYKDIYGYQDRLTDGNDVHLELYFEAEYLDKYLSVGDVITVEMQSIDRKMYEYYSSLHDALMENAGSGFFFTPVPGNPLSNVSNDALGYFSAYASTKTTVVVDTLFEKD